MIMFKLVLPFLLDILKEYIASSVTENDDKILEIVQSGAKYLAKEKTTNVTATIAEELEKCTWGEEDDL